MTFSEVRRLQEGDAIRFMALKEAIVSVVTENYVRIVWTFGGASDILANRSPLWEWMTKL